MPSLAERLLLEPLRNRIAVNAKDGSVLVYVPGGAFEMGDGEDTDCPRHRVELTAYWIGVYAVTNAQDLKFVEATGHRAPDASDYSSAPAVWRGKSFPEEKAGHPVVCVSWEDAVAYAKWAGCELASEAQWEKACRGPLGVRYPWGEEWDAKKCRHDKNKGNETTSAVYGYAAGASGYGTYNQSGNVWEWCGDRYDENYYKRSASKDPRGPDRGSSRVYRGGCWWRDAPADFRAAYRGRDDLGNRAAARFHSSRRVGLARRKPSKRLDREVNRRKAMGTKKMRIRFGRDGRTEIKVEGGEGDDCLAFTRAVEDALGVVEHREPCPPDEDPLVVHTRDEVKEGL